MIYSRASIISEWAADTVTLKLLHMDNPAIGVVYLGVDDLTFVPNRYMTPRLSVIRVVSTGDNRFRHLTECWKRLLDEIVIQLNRDGE